MIKPIPAASGIRIRKMAGRRGKHQASGAQLQINSNHQISEFEIKSFSLLEIENLDSQSIRLRKARKESK
jgi:hypothetical protein